MLLGQKIILGVVIIAMILLLAGGFRTSRGIQLQTDIDHIIQTHVNELSSASKIAYSVQQAKSNIRLLLLEMTPGFQGHRKHAEDAKKEIRQSLTASKQALTSLQAATTAQLKDSQEEKEELKLLASLSKKLELFSVKAHHTISLLETEGFEQAWRFSENQVRPISIEIQSDIKKMELDAKKELDAALQATEDYVQSNIWKSITATAIAIIAAILLGLFISTSIARNIRKLQQVAFDIGSGKLDARVVIDSKDEIGQLAGDINQMAERLRAAIISRDDLMQEIAERKKLEAGLQQSKMRYQRMADSASDVLYSASIPDLKCIDISESIKHQLGFTPVEWLGDPDIWMKQIHDEDRERVIAQINAALKKGENLVLEYRMWHKDGKNLSYFEDRAFWARDHRDQIIAIQGIMVDITERKQAEAELIESNARIRLLLDSTGEAIYGLDADGTCILVNKACIRMLGYSYESELLGKNMHEMMHHSHADGHTYPQAECKITRAFHEGMNEVHVDDEVLWRKDGSSFPASYWSHLIYKGEIAIGSVVTFLDISDQIRSSNALKESQAQLQAALEGTIASVAKAVEARDPYTAGHQRRVADLASAIGREMGLSDEQVKGIYLGATIHDIGKITLPAEMLTKPSRLTKLEYQIIQGHVEAGYNILKDIKFPWPVADIAHQHHERFDGTGYPQGLKGNEICMEGQIVAVADVVEAMSSHRPYRPGLGIESALNEIQTHRGTLYAKEPVDACLKLFEEKRFSF